MRVLLVEDNETLASGIARVLADSGLQIDPVTTGEEAEAALAALDYDLMILDLTLPDTDGMEVLKAARSRGQSLPVLIITARGDLDDRIRGLDAGADDYLTKPFQISELEARVRALLRRAGGAASSVLRYKSLHLDLVNGTVQDTSGPVDLTPREFSLLRKLALSQGRIVPKGELLTALSSFDADISDNAVEQLISRMRKRLAPRGVDVRTARGLGYYLPEDGAP